MSRPASRPARGSSGLLLALASAISFAASGSFASSLIRVGWTPGAAVTVRIVLATAALTMPAVIALHGRWSLLVRSWRPVLLYGLVAVAGAQLFYFNAVQRISVGVALLLEYLGTVLVVGWMWFRHARRPRRLTVLGAAVSLIGLVLVLDLIGHHRLDPAGVLWGLAAAVGLAVYFVLSSSSDSGLPPLVLAWAGLAVGGFALVLADVAGLLPVRAPLVAVTLMGRQVSWLVPVLGLSVLAGAFAYVTGIVATRLLGATVASFVGLAEVIGAVLIAWVLLRQVPAGIQLLGGLFIVTGVSLVRLDDFRASAAVFPDAVDSEVANH